MNVEFIKYNAPARTVYTVLHCSAENVYPEFSGICFRAPDDLQVYVRFEV